jgi:plasmid stabilization system protein ParE
VSRLFTAWRLLLWQRGSQQLSARASECQQVAERLSRALRWRIDREAAKDAQRQQRAEQEELVRSFRAWRRLVQSERKNREFVEVCRFFHKKFVLTSVLTQHLILVSFFVFECFFRILMICLLQYLNLFYPS